MKRLVIVAFLLIVIALAPNVSVAHADDDIEKQLNETVEETLEEIDFGDIEALVGEMGTDDLLGGGFLDKVKAVLSGEFSENAADFGESLLSLLLSGIVGFLPLLLSIGAVCVLSGSLSSFKSRVLGAGTSEIVFFACYAVIILLTLAGVFEMFNTAKTAVTVIRRITETVMPVMLTMMAAVGGTVSAKVYQPSVAFMCNGVIEIVLTVVLPMFLICMVFTVVSNLSKNVRLDKLANFFKSLSVWIIGICFTLFSSFLTVQGVAASAADGVSIKAAKFAARNYIPILGGYLSDGMDLILTGGVLIKNAVGVAGLCLLVGAILAPVCKIAVFALGLKFVASIVEPMTDSRTSGFLFTVSQNISILYVAVLAAGFMLFVLCMLCILTANSLAL